MIRVGSTRLPRYDVTVAQHKARRSLQLQRAARMSPARSATAVVVLRFRDPLRNLPEANPANVDVNEVRARIVADAAAAQIERHAP